MGFGIGSIGDAVKGAVKSVSDAVGGAAKAVGDGAKAVEEKVAGAIKSAVEGATGHDGWDDDKPGHGPLAESKPKGGSGSSYA